MGRIIGTSVRVVLLCVSHVVGISNASVRVRSLLTLSISLALVCKVSPYRGECDLFSNVA
jgi:hypothetical protein